MDHKEGDDEHVVGRHDSNPDFYRLIGLMVPFAYLLFLVCS